MPVRSTVSFLFLKLTYLHLGIDVSLRSVAQAKRLSCSAITWKRTSIDQVLASPVSPSAAPFDVTPIKTKSKKSLSISTNADDLWYGSNVSPIDRCGSPVPMYCTGLCRDNPPLEERPLPDVVRVLSFLTQAD
jgi:hypothetical protein